MKTSPSSRRQAGYVSFLMVLSTGAILTLLTIYAYRSAMAAHAVTSQVQLRVDYSEKNEAILRAIVAITPNRAIRAMQSGSDVAGTREPLSWQSIFTESMVLANAGTSISSDLQGSLGVANLKIANTGDSTLSSPSKIFAAIPSETGYVSAGINRSLGTGYPAPLTSSDYTTSTRDAIYPIISDHKYDALATSGFGPLFQSRPKFNILKYPQINFGYAKPGDDFVAKRNWWAFSVDVAGNDSDKTYLARNKRNFVLSIYEIPSQLSISASSFMSLGQYASGSAWQNVTIDGGVFAGKAEVLGTTAINALASRRAMTLSSDSTVGGQSFTNSPFTPGVRESYQVTSGAFFPVSLASESGRSAFIPINRGKLFFDRFDDTVTNGDGIGEEDGSLRYSNNVTESNVLSTTSWNNYSIGALQCAMRLDITGVASSTDPTPTMLRFTYYQTDGTRASMNMPLTTATQTTLPAGYVKVCDENGTVDLSALDSGRPVDVAYGVSGGYTFRQSLSGTIAFNNNTFGDPKVGASKAGYWRTRGPSEIKTLASGQKCVAVYPERIPALLTAMGAAGPAINNSLVVNVDYSSTGLNNAAKYKPYIPCTSNDYGVILRECGNLTPFTKGFSLVTNLRLYIGDDFNTAAITAPSGYTPPVTAANPTGSYFPPCSLFSPEKRYGVDVNPFAVDLRGQVGSLAKVDKVKASNEDRTVPVVRPLDSKDLSGTAIDPSQITVNLSPITHPAQLPPITMMNWLVVLEERRKEFVSY